MAGSLGLPDCGTAMVPGMKTGPVPQRNRSRPAFTPASDMDVTLVRQQQQQRYVHVVKGGRAPAAPRPAAADDRSRLVTPRFGAAVSRAAACRWPPRGEPIRRKGGYARDCPLPGGKVRVKN